MNREEFSKLLDNVGVKLSDNQFEQLDKYYEILVEWNEFMNLTGITEYDEVLVKHFLDSLAVKYAIDQSGLFCKKLDFNSDISVIDVGTGAGFPGLPLKIAFPDINAVLMDSLNKRVKFLNEVSNQIGLSGIDNVHMRAEEGARNVKYRENFDVCVSRAVANLSTLTEYCLPFVNVGGYFIAYKSGEIDEEAEKSVNAVKKLGGCIEKIYKMTLPGTDIERSFVFIKKIEKTSKKYPRKAGIPSKEPL